MTLNYFFEGVDEFSTPLSFQNWVESIETEYNCTLSINYIFVTNAKILEINKQYLNHNYFTDIITFNLSENETDIKSDIFISVETVQENALDRKLSFTNEITRVMVHGILHLIGFNDSNEEEQLEMTNQENKALSKIFTVSRETNY